MCCLLRLVYPAVQYTDSTVTIDIQHTTCYQINKKTHFQPQPRYTFLKRFAMKTPNFVWVCLLGCSFFVSFALSEDTVDVPESNTQTEPVLDSEPQRESQPLVPDTGAERDCRLSSFQLQPDFNLAQFEGYWYSLTINRYWLAVPRWFPVRQSNVQVNYRLLSDGSLEVKTGGEFMFPFCDYIAGKGYIPDKTQPQKLEVQFDTLLTRTSRKNPYWVVSTDYEGFAVIYSCWKEREDGTCHPDYTYMWTLNRKRGGHTPEQEEKIKMAVERMCVQPDNFKTFKQNGSCKFDPDKFPSGGLGLIPFLVIAVIMFLILGVLMYCCIAKTDRVAETKKTQ
ncbi:retinol-binding protein 4-like [Mizuhopecten yessoensis]|uniref:Retinol-binding protein 4 n=1 Tax=Mizuhopecten yessoensis TaxID=6573 RepID=A0A210QGM7_MIZYE|nr:retinol-binding protein 4-like [Mizuhopecten yessoensis]OWF47923.1 Retinol-binding protein 4 [Mizuhopecten yessoensis]